MTCNFVGGTTRYVERNDSLRGANRPTRGRSTGTRHGMVQCVKDYWPIGDGEGLSKNRLDNDGTGRSVPPAAGCHIIALMTRRGGRRDSNYCQLMKA